MSFKFLTTDDGAFYAVQETGELLRYRDVFRNGTNAPDASTGWHPNSQSEIGVGWKRLQGAARRRLASFRAVSQPCAARSRTGSPVDLIVDRINDSVGEAQR